MSTRVSSWVWHDAPAVSGNELVVLLALADVANDDGLVTFADHLRGLTYEALGRKARVSRSTIIRVVASLKAQDLIDHEPGTKVAPNVFRVLVPWGVNLEPNGPDGVSTPNGFGVNSDARSSLSRKNVNTSDSVFAAAWAEWPRSDGRKAALRAWNAALRRILDDWKINAVQPFVDVAVPASADAALQAAVVVRAEAYRRAGIEARFVPHLSTWLNGDRWTDPLQVGDRDATAGAPNPTAADDTWLGALR